MLGPPFVFHGQLPQSDAGSIEPVEGLSLRGFGLQRELLLAPHFPGCHPGGVLGHMGWAPDDLAIWLGLSKRLFPWATVPAPDGLTRGPGVCSGHSFDDTTKASLQFL